MKRIFVIGMSKFPRGSAFANYIQYLLLAIREIGYSIYFITDINEEFMNLKSNILEYKGIVIRPVIISKNRIIRYFQYKNGFTGIRLKHLKRDNICSDDIVITFVSSRKFYEKLFLLRRKIGFKIICGVLELFEQKDMVGKNYKKMIKRYIDYKYIIDKMIPQVDVVMPISTYIEQYYKQKGAKTVCIPIMADSSEFDIQYKSMDKYRFILPANGKMKDNLISMLEGFVLLEDRELSMVELHLCGIKEDTIKEILSYEDYKRIKRILFFYKWMKYDELISLYQRMHFLILSREISQMTLANFPSKVPETMGLGIVPVVSDVGDYTKYYLRDGVDSIFIIGSSSKDCKIAIKRAIALSEKEYKCLSENAVALVKERFDYHIWIPTIKKMLEEV